MSSHNISSPVYKHTMALCPNAPIFNQTHLVWGTWFQLFVNLFLIRLTSLWRHQQVPEKPQYEIFFRKETNFSTPQQLIKHTLHIPTQCTISYLINIFKSLQGQRCRSLPSLSHFITNYGLGKNAAGFLTSFS